MAIEMSLNIWRWAMERSVVNTNTDREGFYPYRCLIEMSCQACVIESSRLLEGGSLGAIGYHTRFDDFSGELVM